MSLRLAEAPPFVVSMFLDFPSFLPTLDPEAAHTPKHQIPTAWPVAGEGGQVSEEGRDVYSCVAGCTVK